MRKNLLPVFLSILAAAVWGYNGFELYRGLAETSDTSATFLGRTIDLNGSEIDDRTGRKQYSGDFRDPFRNWLEPITESKRVVQPKSEPKPKPMKLRRHTRPELRLTGILSGDGGTMAIIEAPDAQIVFAQRGDRVAGVSIVGIDTATVACRFDGSNYKLNLR